MAATRACPSAAPRGLDAAVAGMARSCKSEEVAAEVIDATTHL